jgi:UDP-2-acetamido-3-amino-2,3-dideoxy-glucuronate N-acetyltransferase
VIHPSARIHSTAHVEDDVDVGADTTIGERAVVRAGASIGARSRVGRDAFIDGGVRVGDSVTIHDGARLYRGVIVDDAVFVGPGAILTNDRYPRTMAATSEATLAVADERSDQIAPGGDPKPSPVILRRGSSVGAGAVIVAPADVGSFATVGAGAVVTRDVSGHALVAGSPARRLGWVCACGHRLLDSNGHPAPAEPERYATDTDLVCVNCGRRYGYVPDGETLEQRTGPRQGAPA